MTTWRDELVEAVKSQTERDAENEARKQKRLAEALTVADEAMEKASEGLRFANEQFQSKAQTCSLAEADGGLTFKLGDLSIALQLARDSAVLKVTFNDGRPREFDFAKDRHLSPRDVEEYVGRRAVELARAAQKANPW